MYKVANGYTRSEFAKKVGIDRVTLIRWEKKGILTPKYTVSGLPYYTDEHLQELKEKER